MESEESEIKSKQASKRDRTLQIAKDPLQISFKHLEPFLAFVVNF
jgi:hypothetical protein